MRGRLLAGVTLLLLYALGSTPTVEGQTSCAITDATIKIDETTNNPPNQFRDRSSLQVSLDGVTTGGEYTSITWTRNGTTLSTVNPVPGVPNSEIFIGGGEERVGGDPCSARMYRPALVIRGYLPGVYQYTVDNADTPGDVTSPTFSISDSGPPSNLMLTQVNGRRVQASWTAPSNPFVDYRVFVDDTNVNGNGSIVASGTTTYTTTSQFSAVTTVTIRVRATATYWSEVAMESITVLALLNPVVTPSPATTSVILTLSQSTNSLPSNQYIATLTSSVCPNIPTRMGTTTNGSLMINDLNVGMEYNVSVTATNTVTGLTSTTTTTVTTQEAAPSGPPGTPSLRTSTPTSIELTWTNIECLQQKGIITNFTIRYRLQGSTQDITVNTQTATTSFNVTGLSAFTAYTFSVAGSNSIGMGGFSATANLRTTEDKPAMVGNLIGTPQLFTINLTWDVPAQLNGIIIQYTILYSVNASALIRNTTTLTTFVIIDLNPNTRVSNITVYATTGVGDGPVVMLQCAIITLQRPPKVLNVAVEFLNSTSVKVSWDRLNIPKITRYLVYYTTQRQMESTVQVIATASSVVINNTTINGIYTFQVAAQVVLDGVVIIGTKSDRNTLVVISDPSFNKSNEDLIITPVVVFVATVVLYSIILMVLGISCYCYRKRKHGNKFIPEATHADQTTHATMHGPENIEFKTCEAYGQLVLESTPQHYETLEESYAN